MEEIKSTAQFYIVSHSGWKLRRQHWCLLLVVGVAAVFGLYAVISKSSSTFANLGDVANDPQLQQATVAQLLREVPLVDG